MKLLVLFATLAIVAHLPLETEALPNIGGGTGIIPTTIAGLTTLPAEIAKATCDLWYNSDPGAPTDILHCPPTLEQAQNDPRFIPDESTGEVLQFYHPGAEFSFRQKTPSPSGAGQQCVYKGGQLLIGPPGGGTADSVSPTTTQGRVGHILNDVVTWYNCCKLTNDDKYCLKYYEKRPSDTGVNYSAP